MAEIVNNDKLILILTQYGLDRVASNFNDMLDFILAYEG